jgi:hypothetical protein
VCVCVCVWVGAAGYVLMSLVLAVPRNGGLRLDGLACGGRRARGGGGGQAEQARIGFFSDYAAQLQGCVVWVLPHAVPRNSSLGLNVLASGTVEGGGVQRACYVIRRCTG